MRNMSELCQVPITSDSSDDENYRNTMYEINNNITKLSNKLNQVNSNIVYLTKKQIIVEYIMYMSLLFNFFYFIKY